MDLHWANLIGAQPKPSRCPLSPESFLLFLSIYSHRSFGVHSERDGGRWRRFPSSRRRYLRRTATPHPPPRGLAGLFHACAPILQRHSKLGKGVLPSSRESNNIYGWTTKRSRYNNLTILGVEAFDVASNNLDVFRRSRIIWGHHIKEVHT